MLRAKKVPELLALYSDVMKELQTRGLRSANNPVAEIAEILVTKVLHLERKQESTAGYDAVDSSGHRYEIKSRRLTARHKSRQLSTIRGLEKDHFTYLVGVLFQEDFSLLRACVVPIKIVKQEAKYVEHVNGWNLILRDRIWELPGVRDITNEVRRALAAL